MTPKAKKILLIVAVLAASIIAYGAYKAWQLKAIFDQMTIKPGGLPKNIKASLTNMRFELDVVLSNPTAEKFALTGYVATLKKVMVKYKGVYLGQANVNIDEIIVPDNSTAIIPNVPIDVATTALLDNLMVFTSGAFKLSDFEIKGEVEVLGKIYQIG